jgi:hypothetical protein
MSTAQLLAPPSVPRSCRVPIFQTNARVTRPPSAFLAAVSERPTT